MNRSRRKAVLDAARKKFGVGNPYGVVAFGIGRRTKRGMPRGGEVLRAYVLQKRPAAKHPLDMLRVDDFEIPIDVTGLGVAARSHEAANKPPMLGLYNGAAIRVRGTNPEFGGVAWILHDGAGPTHLVTAGHVFEAGVSGVVVQGAALGEPMRSIGKLEVNLLDLPFPGMPHPIDAALVTLNDEGVRIVRQSSDGPRMGGTVATDFSLDIDVRAFLPTAHDYSGTTRTLDHTVDVNMFSMVRGAYFVRGVIATSSVITNPGDSGTILFNGSPSNALGVGICVGQIGAISVFEPIERALAAIANGLGGSFSAF